MIKETLNKSTVKSVCDILRMDDGVSATNYVEQFSWLLFLKIHEKIENQLFQIYKIKKIKYSKTIENKFQWSQWTSKEWKDKYQLIKYINSSNKYILSIDVPSGLSSVYEQKNNNTNTIIASETLCISGIKDCCLTINGHKYSNKLINLDIGITEYPKNYKYKFLINPQSAFKLIPKKDTYGDKRLSGETLIVGGSKKYPGSILMAASASLETGVGLLSLAIPLSIYDVIAGKIPEATLDTIKNNQEFISKDNIKHLFENKKRINSLLIGCGMESNNTTQTSVKFLLKNISNHFKYLNGIVIDADGLNNLSKINEWWKYKLPKNTIITPHVREMSRLTGLSISEINKNPIEILET